MSASSKPVGDEAIVKMIAKHGQYIVDLCERWQDEKQYEDIAEYKVAIAKRLPVGFKVTRMTKDPFGFAFTHDHKKYTLKCVVTVDQISLVCDRQTPTPTEH